MSKEQISDIILPIVKYYNDHYPDLITIDRIEIDDSNNITIKFIETEQDIGESVDKFNSIVENLMQNIADNNSPRVRVIGMNSACYATPDFNDESNTKFTINTKLSFDVLYKNLLSIVRRASLDTEHEFLKDLGHYYSFKTSRLGDQIPAFTASGSALIQYYYAQKYPKSQHVFFIESKSKFIEFLQILKNENLPNNINLGFEMICQPNNHVQSVKLERRNNINKFIIIDSLGFSTNHTQNTIGLISQILPNARIRYNPDIIQSDEFSCYTYTPKLLNRMMNIDNLFDDMVLDHVNKIPLYQNNVKIESAMVPPIFMDLCQSFGNFSKYIARNQNILQEEQITKAQEKIAKHKIFKNLHITPKAADDGTAKFRIIYYFAHKYADIIAKYIEKFSENEIRESINNRSSNNLNLDKLHQISQDQEDLKKLEEKQKLQKLEEKEERSVYKKMNKALNPLLLCLGMGVVLEQSYNLFVEDDKKSTMVTNSFATMLTVKATSFLARN